MTVRLETERLILAIASPEDAPRLAAYADRNRDHHARWAPEAPPDFFTEGFWRVRQTRALDEYRRDSALKLTLFRRDDPDGPIVGHANFTEIVRGPVQICQLGYSLDQAAQGQGVMSEALRRAIKLVFEDLALHRIRATYSPVNERSARLLRRLGFVVEGYARDYLFANQRWEDQVVVGLVGSSAPPRVRK